MSTTLHKCTLVSLNTYTAYTSLKANVHYKSLFIQNIFTFCLVKIDPLNLHICPITKKLLDDDVYFSLIWKLLNTEKEKERVSALGNQ